MNDEDLGEKPRRGSPFFERGARTGHSVKVVIPCEKSRHSCHRGQARQTPQGSAALALWPWLRGLLLKLSGIFRRLFGLDLASLASGQADQPHGRGGGGP